MAKVSLRTGQYKRLGRLSAKNPDKAENVAERMIERRSRVARGKEYLDKNVGKLYPSVPTVGKKGTKVAKKMAKGGKVAFGMLSVKKGIDNNPNPTQADRIAGATMKKGGKVKKAANGITTTLAQRSARAAKPVISAASDKRKSRAAVALNPTMKKGGKVGAKKMKSGGKCRGGCY